MKWTRVGVSKDCPGGLARYGIRDRSLFIWCGGTQGKRQWLDNFRFRTIKTDMGRVNRADLLQAKHVLKLIPSTKGFYHVQIMGLSRGFAIAQILAVLINAFDNQHVSLNGFAGKRTGNKKFMKYLLKATFHIDHYAYKCDVVPFLPFGCSQTRIHWQKGFYNPAKAHIKGARLAAMWRHDLAQEWGDE